MIHRKTRVAIWKLQKALPAKRAEKEGLGVVVIEGKPDVCREQEENDVSDEHPRRCLLLQIRGFLVEVELFPSLHANIVRLYPQSRE